MLKNTQPIYPNSYYHIYNRGNNRERIYFSDENYRYFLKKYDNYLSNHIETYVYSLIPNHFHLLIKTKNNSEMVSELFRRLFITYSQKINAQENRSGSLFLKPFKRKLISDNNNLQRVIFYIHHNPIHHGLSKNLEDYRWSSYRTILNDSDTRLKRKEVIKLFGCKENFIQFHKDMLKLEEMPSIYLQ